MAQIELLEEGYAFFPEYEIGAYVIPVIQGKSMENPISLKTDGTIGLSPKECKMVTGFRLGLEHPKDAPVVIVQRNLRHIPEAPYHRHALLRSRKGGDWMFWEMQDHMRVYRKGGISYTVWQAVVPNRIDLWFLSPEGLSKLFQIGIIARGETDGRDLHFRLLGELRGEWQLAHDPEGKVVGIPTNPVWGAFDVRRPILDNPDFRALLNKAHLPSWAGSEEELNLPLELPSEPNQAIMEWWSPFTGMRGQGPIAPKGSNTWVCGEDIVETEPDLDGILRLPRGTLISFEGSTPFGEKGDKKLLQVRRIQTGA